MNNVICMPESYWRNSHLSLAAIYGSVRFLGHDYVIVNKEGKDIYQCSREAERDGREKAIEPGEPCDLCRCDFVKYYRKLGRDRFLQVLKDNEQASDAQLKRIYQTTK